MDLTGALQRAELFGRPLPGWAQAALTPRQWVPLSQLATKATVASPFSPPPAAAAAPPTEVGSMGPYSGGWLLLLPVWQSLQGEMLAKWLNIFPAACSCVM